RRYSVAPSSIDTSMAYARFLTGYPALSSRPESPVCRLAGARKKVVNSGVLALLAEGVGFEPTRERKPPAGFQDRCFQPLSHPSKGACQSLRSLEFGLIAGRRLASRCAGRQQPIGDGCFARNHTPLKVAHMIVPSPSKFLPGEGTHMRA